MAVLETIRTKIGWLITALIVIALLSFIIDPNSLASVWQATSEKYSVGKINGKKVSRKDFDERVTYYTDVAEMLSGNSANSEEGQKMIRQEAWQYFINNFLFLKKAKAAGIEVGKDEMMDLTTGDMLSPALMYTPFFRGTDGGVDKAKIVEFVKTIDSDPSGRQKMYWNYLYDQIYNSQMMAKYASLFTASNMPNSLMVAAALQENNTTASASFVRIPYGMENDSTITVSSSEIKEYYKNHKKNYKQVESRDIEYVLFDVVPSAEDIAATRDDFDKVYEEFATTDNMQRFLAANYSERLFDNRYYKDGELQDVNSEINDFVFGGNGTVSPVITDGDSFYAARVLDTKALADSVFVRHILIQGNEELADSLFKVVKANPAQLTDLAALYSAVQTQPGETPGDIGWLTQTQMVPGMESVLTAKLNEPYVLDTQYGRHIVVVTKATKPVQKKMVAIYMKTASASGATMDAIYSKANELITKSNGTVEGMEEAVKELELTSSWRTLNKVVESNEQYAYVNKAKTVTRAIYEDDVKAGKVLPNIVSVDQKHLFVVGVKAIHNEGYTPIEEVAARIQDQIHHEKYADKLLADVKAKIEGATDIEAVAEMFNQAVTSAENVTFSTLRSAQPYEPALVGAIAGAELNKLTGPVKGATGLYVVYVTGRDTKSFFTEDDVRDDQNMKNNMSLNAILPVMFDASGSVDHVARAY